MSDKLNLTQFCFASSAKKAPEKTAILEVYCADATRSYTYAEIYQQILNLAQGFVALNHPHGGHVLIRSVKNVDFLVLYFAAKELTLLIETLL